ncbi:hypothetical protein V6N12_013256 [Hibiscus sabdariffa]|uniref:Uncharacterized protein n=1 Tax=Hibiscus sabdariffa TaxID=183260 RepID=A0ABR2D6W1_9ROSI
MLSDFMMLPAVERSNRTTAQERLVRQQIAHADEKVKRLCENNRRKEITQFMFQSLGGQGLHHLNRDD